MKKFSLLNIGILLGVTTGFVFFIGSTSVVADCVPRDQVCWYGGLPGTCGVPDQSDISCYSSNKGYWRNHNLPAFNQSDVDNADGTTTRTYKIYKTATCNADGTGDRTFNDWWNPQILVVTLCAVSSFKEVMRVSCPAPMGEVRIAGTLNGLSSLKIQKSDGTYGIELLDDLTSPNASCVRVQMPTGLKALRKCDGFEPNCI